MIIPKVSIIVAAYNVEKYIEKCLLSLINQTLTDIEILIIDDGSTDGTAERIKKFTDKRIKYLKKENGGLSDARNYGINHARGEYLTFVDGDDFVELDIYEKLYTTAQIGKFDLVECGYFKDFQNYTVKKIDKERFLKKINFKPYNQWNKLLKFDLIKNNGLKFKENIWYEDFDFNIKLATFVKNATYLPIPLYHYIQRDDSIMHSITQKVKDIYKIVDDVILFYKENNMYKKFYDDLEYLFIKELLLSSGKRFLEHDILKKTDLLNKNFLFVKNYFPNWKKNPYLKKQSKVNLVLKLITPFSYKIIIMLLVKLKLLD